MLFTSNIRHSNSKTAAVPLGEKKKSTNRTRKHMIRTFVVKDWCPGPVLSTSRVGKITIVVNVIIII